MLNHFSVVRPSSRGWKSSSGIERLKEIVTNRQVYARSTGWAVQASFKKCLKILLTSPEHDKYVYASSNISYIVSKRTVVSEHTKVAGRKA